MKVGSASVPTSERRAPAVAKAMARHAEAHPTSEPGTPFLPQSSVLITQPFCYYLGKQMPDCSSHPISILSAF